MPFLLSDIPGPRPISREDAHPMYPPNRTMMLLCKQKNKWIAAEEDELRSFAVNNVMTKNPRPPANGKELPLKWIYTVKTT